MSIYTVEDSQQRTIGVYTDYDMACDALVEWAEHFLDDVELVRCPAKEKNVSSCEAYIKGGYEIDPEYGLTVQLWIENELA